ncbi:uncharacterized protein A4U43_C02F6070 [Asparagus officinalis]|uniref:Uncharacterized protein n=1 Tax=Asparagus officinalis TaxID=4686 RepID=A0A5P1FI55_ASPOF|nr:uncharacterized protein A4U43_C02F6070 [Asparagus officinalis]
MTADFVGDSGVPSADPDDPGHAVVGRGEEMRRDKLTAEEKLCASHVLIYPAKSPQNPKQIFFPFTLSLMTASASSSSSLIHRVFSPLSSPNGGNLSFRSQLPVGPSKPTLLSMRTPPLAVAFARRNKKSSSLISSNEKKSPKLRWLTIKSY